MAKRKQSKKHPLPSEATAEAPPSAPAETATETTADALVDAPVVQAIPEETPSAAAPVGEVAPASEAAPEASAEPWPVPESEPDPPAESWSWPEGAPEASAEQASGDPAADAALAEPLPEASRLVSIIESLLFASDKPLGLSDLKRLLGERDGKKIAAAVETLSEQRAGTGVEVTTLSSGWLLRTNPENAAWVSKLLVGRPIRLSRAMLETLSIVAYRQPVTRPEVDDIRGVDCGPVLGTLLDRGLVRIIGKKEEVGRPILYGTTPEFLRIFNLRELAELPTLREFYDLTAEEQSRVESEHGPTREPAPASATSPKPEVALSAVSRAELPPEAEETDPLLDELDAASRLAKKALGDVEPPAAEGGRLEAEGGSPEAEGKAETPPASE